MIGHVVLRGFLVAGDGRFAGTRDVADTLHVTSRGDIYPVPNPFGAATLGYFEVSDTVLVEGRILDLAGKSVRELLTAQLPTGLWELLWDGLDDGGHAVSGPIYWMTLTEPTGARGQLIFREPGLPAPSGSAGALRGRRLLAERAKMARAALTPSPP
jgi:hypothetical protein